MIPTHYATLLLKTYERNSLTKMVESGMFRFKNDQSM